MEAAEILLRRGEDVDDRRAKPRSPRPMYIVEFCKAGPTNHRAYINFALLTY